MTGTFNVEFSFPNTKEFTGTVKKIIRVDAYDSIENVIAVVCKKMRVKPHLYEISFEGKILDKKESLMKHGLGITCRTMQLQLQQKFYPLGTNPTEGEVNKSNSQSR